MQGRFEREFSPREIGGAPADLMVLFQEKHLKTVARQMGTRRKSSHPAADDDNVIVSLVGGAPLICAATDHEEGEGENKNENCQNNTVSFSHRLPPDIVWGVIIFLEISAVSMQRLERSLRFCRRLFIGATASQRPRLPACGL